VTQKIIHRKLFLSFILLSFVAVACGSSSDNDDSETVEETTSDQQSVEVQTVIVVATPTLDPAAGESEATQSEEAAPSSAPVLEAPTAKPGEPTMTALVDLNVRTGPGTHYTPVGALLAGSSARIIGNSPDGFWWKIECPPGSGSECWSSAGSQFSSATNVDGVLVAAVPPPPPTQTPAATQTAEVTSTPTATATEEGNASPTATPTATTAADQPTATATQVTEEATATYTPTPTQAPLVAEFDNDSLQNPAVSVFFSPTGTRNFTHVNKISFPDGDNDDWVEFEFPNNSNSSQRVWVTLECTITGDPGAQLRATVYENESNTNQIAICNQGEVQLTVDNTKKQQLRIHFGITGDGILADYTVTVVGFK